MIIQIKVIPHAKKEKIEKFGDGLKVWLKAPAQKGKANKALLLLLAKYFNVPKDCLKIISGLNKPNKIIKIEC